MGKEHANDKNSKNRHSSSSSNSSSENSSDSSADSAKYRKEMKKLKKKIKKEERKTAKRLKKKLKADRKKHKKSKRITEKCEISQSKQSQIEIVPKPIPAEKSSNIPLGLMEKSKIMAPMTKEEWEKRQSVVRKVLDEESGRYRLIKGDGEVLEEIVSQKRHKEINRQATLADGTFFQSQMRNK